MNHPADLLSAHLDGELSAVESTQVLDHLTGCQSCREELAAVTVARDLLRALPMLEAPIPLLPTERRPRRWITAAASVAAGALAVGLVLAPGQSAPVFDLDTLAGQHTTRVGVDPGISTLRSPMGAP